ncbi:hypothetical protein SAMN04515647_2017 [Cohaesibacter sp. ES.047]|uniref:hypothetical protein n=1 Tax=Cohaesibacter sp. ES.047 TaxID=1798205 RepID=UPI000BB9945C|nr:hypothetical protein [Cohaesibacter sp. ES.047]SNY91775.1 hypothetical protein SAMN04515647_2017 [Cohaesibacter sp. ES.047]
MTGRALHVLFIVALFMFSSFTVSRALAYSGELYRVCGLNPYGDNYLSLRTCGSTRCREIARLGPGTPLRSFEPVGMHGWREVEVLPSLDAPYVGGYQIGWVFEKYICTVRY